MIGGMAVVLEGKFQIRMGSNESLRILVLKRTERDVYFRGENDYIGITKVFLIAQASVSGTQIAI